VEPSGLARGDVRALRVQRAASRLLAPLWVPLTAAAMRFALGWRIEPAERLAARRAYRAARASRAPLLVCANHLTMLDSFAIGHALGGVGFYLRDFDALPWNVPEAAHFASTRWKRALVWLYKCVPIRRGGDRREVARVLAKLRFLLARGEAVLVFPEGGRSRSGHVEPDAGAWGVGRLVASLPGCRVFCVHLRGEGQAGFSTSPRRGERFRVSVALIEPKTDARGPRGSLALARQITARLAELEREHLAAG
jgi:hypothetical protein